MKIITWETECGCILDITPVEGQEDWRIVNVKQCCPEHKGLLPAHHYQACKEISIQLTEERNGA